MPEQLEVFVASVAQTLNSNQIPCILWGHYLLNIHGIPSALAVCIYEQLYHAVNTDSLSVC